MSTTIIGFPRLGEFRELKFTTEKYFRNEITADELLAAAKDLRAKHWNIVKEKGITEIPSNDFSHYDNFLDAAFLFFNRYTGPVSHELVRPCQCVKQCSLTTVRISCQCNFN